MRSSIRRDFQWRGVRIL